MASVKKDVAGAKTGVARSKNGVAKEMGHPRVAESNLNVLNGTKHLVIGNHHSEGTLTASGWASVQPYAEIAEAGEGSC